MSMMLVSHMIIKGEVANTVAMALVKVLLRKIHKLQDKRTTVSNIGEFVIIIWQRFS
jgi:hypothetical protein